METGKAWTKEELTEALELYSKLRFGQVHELNPEIICFAEQLRRSPREVVLKLCQFGSFDERLQAMNILGAPGANQLDREIWDASIHAF
jgi:putative restriction endonuclease